MKPKDILRNSKNLLGTNRTDFTNSEMVKANVPRNKDMDTFSKKS